MTEPQLGQSAVFAVVYSNYSPAEIDSFWKTKEGAEKRADELNDTAISGADNWHVEEWQVQDA